MYARQKAVAARQTFAQLFGLTFRSHRGAQRDGLVRGSYFESVIFARLRPPRLEVVRFGCGDRSQLSAPLVRETFEAGRIFSKLVTIEPRRSAARRRGAFSGVRLSHRCRFAACYAGSRSPSHSRMTTCFPRFLLLLAAAFAATSIHAIRRRLLLRVQKCYCCYAQSDAICDPEEWPAHRLQH